MTPPKSHIWMWILLGIGVVGIGVAGIASWNIVQFEKWVEEDSGHLNPFPNHLVQKGEKMEGVDSRDDVLVEHTIEGRNVMELTRSEYRTSWSGKIAWVKVHLVTERPNSDNRGQEIKLLYKMSTNDGSWEIVETDALTLP